VTVSEALKSMAKLAIENRIRGNTTKRNALLTPVSILFDKVRQQQPVLDVEALRAAAIETVYDHLYRISDMGRGEKTRVAVEAIANYFFQTLLKENYGGKVHHLIRDEKDIKSAYLFYVRSNLGNKEE
jgi:hypothetical protein